MVIVVRNAVPSTKPTLFTNCTSCCGSFSYAFCSPTRSHPVKKSLRIMKTMITTMLIMTLISIVAISLCGVFGVMVVPIMQKVFYQHLIQFLVALAIGTLAGDALLHLCPHALLADLHLHDDDNDQVANAEIQHQQHEEFHQKSVWKGFAALVALLLFFVSEQLINMIGNRKHSKKKKSKSMSSVEM